MAIAFRKGTYRCPCGSDTATVSVHRDLTACEIEHAAREVWREITDENKSGT